MEATQFTSNLMEADVKLSFKERFAFAFGDFGFNFMYYWISAFLMIFYTDVFLVKPAHVAALLLFVRVWDAVIDPFIGSLADRTRTKWGRYRPWVFVASIGMAICLTLLFWAHPNMEYTSRVIYMCVTYILTVTFASCSNMAYGAMNGVLTSNTNERIKLSSLRMTFVKLAMLLIGAIAIPLRNFFGQGDEVRGFVLSVGLCAFIGLIPLLYTAIMSRERVYPPESQKKLPLSKQFKAFFDNKPMLIAFFGMLVYGAITYGRIAVYAYYFRYYVGDMGLYTGFTLVMNGGGVLGTIVAPYLYRLTKNKGRSIAIAMVVLATCTVIEFFNPAPSLIFYLVIFIDGMCGGIYTATQYGIIPDATDYGQYRTGMRVDGFLASTTSFAFSAGNAIATALIPLILGNVGYVPNVDQTDTVRQMINIMLTVGPGALALICALIYSRYDIDEKKHAEILETITTNMKASSESAAS